MHATRATSRKYMSYWWKWCKIKNISSLLFDKIEIQLVQGLESWKWQVDYTMFVLPILPLSLPLLFVSLYWNVIHDKLYLDLKAITS